MKTRNLNHLLAAIEEAHGVDSFIIDDNWEADQEAIGIRKNEHASYLLYFSVSENINDIFIEIEGPPDSKVDFPYSVLQTTDNLSKSEFLQVVERFLNTLSA